jgi:hypothetical protein
VATFRSVLRFIARSGKRLAVTVVGFVLILAGLALAAPGIPGPGFLVIIAGLAVLGTEYAWARRTLDRARERAKSVAQRVRRRGRRAPSEPEAGSEGGSGS